MPHTLLYIRFWLLTATALVLAATTAAAQLPNGVGVLKSPDGKSDLTISVTNDTTMTFAISRNGKTYIDTAQVFLSYGDNRNALNPQKIVGAKSNYQLDTLRSKIWERAVQPAHYNELLVKFQEGQRSLQLHIRLYNQGFATGIDITDPQKNVPKDYHTTYHWVNKGIFHIIDTKSENGYNSLMGRDRATAISPTLTMSTTDTLLALTHEAANYEFFSRAKMALNNFSVTIGQSGLYQIANYSTPWHYVVFADNAADFMEGKYIDRSLCMKPSDRYDWVKPGKVYRHIGNKDADFATDLVKRSIDFAAQMKFQYVLLDNGWYGLGYDAEFDPDSDPMRTVAPLNLPEAIQYAKGKGIGILLYFNKSVFLQSSADSLLTHYSQLGIKGIKIGYLKNRNQQDNVLASHIITKCASLRLIVNVHDEYRP
ncbi:MAG: glycoside hydrolase family 97 catalytic domain-containing protein, partial [Bacteroidales bacterium]|nr:glycoside hydrolase family 97 catalytic domain-containing protein [Bacteroidales bacterium]